MATTLGRGLSPVRAVLGNGARILAQHNPTTPTVALNVTFYTSSELEPRGREGTAYLLSLSLDRGTARRPATAIAEFLDDRGVSLRTWVTSHSFSLSCVCLADDFADVLRMVAEIAIGPAFDAAELEKCRVEAITSVRQDDDSPFARAGNAALEILYGVDHPYGRTLKGRPETLAVLTPADLREYHRRSVVPAGMCVTVAGDVEPEAAVDVVAAAFGAWRGPAPAADVVPAVRVPSRTIQMVPMPGKPQSDIAYALNTVRRVDPRYYAYWMMNNVLGQFGLGGRLADTIRERKGMAYYAYSSLDASVGEGPLLVRAGVDPANVTAAIDAIDDELRRLAADGPTPREVEDTRDSLIGSVPRMLETNENITEFLQTVEQFDLGIDFDRRLPGLLRAVPAADVADAARESLDPERAIIAIAGPHES